MRLHGANAKSTKGGSSIVLTAKQFLGKEGDKPYSNPDEFVKFAERLREPEIEQLDGVFECMQNGDRTIGSIVTRLDKADRPYTFVNFLKSNATVGFKYILEGNMKQFLKDYMDGQFKVGFTLDQLVEEAMND
ncbi:hypothetical protein SAMN04487890_107282 [Mucilaginibacter polytrichastri]|nr:hypothetical protein SAMN04487890_107282 [Mucilaginibacter polytrichastri]